MDFWLKCGGQFEFAPFLAISDYRRTCSLIRLFSSTHLLRIETGTHFQTPREEKTCACSPDLGDEMHFLFDFTLMKDQRCELES